MSRARAGFGTPIPENVSMAFGTWTLSPAEQQWITASAHHLAGQIRLLIDAVKKRPDDHEVRLTLQEAIAEARQLGLIRLSPAR